MTRALQYNYLKSLLNFSTIGCLTLVLLGCSGLGGLATGSKEGESGGNQGGALDEFHSGDQVAGLGNPGGLPGPGGVLTGPGGGMTGGDNGAPPGVGGAGRMK